MRGLRRAMSQRVADAHAQVRSAAAAELELEEKAAVVLDADHAGESAVGMDLAVDAFENDDWSRAVIDRPSRQRAERKAVDKGNVDERLRHTGARRALDARTQGDVGRQGDVGVGAGVPLRRIESGADLKADGLRVRRARAHRQQAHDGKDGARRASDHVVDSESAGETGNSYYMASQFNPAL